MKVFVICLLIILLTPVIALAEEGGLGTLLGNIIIDNILPLAGLGGGAAGIGALILRKLLKDNRKVKTGMQETGEFFKALGSAMEDGKLSMKEVGTIVKEGKDVINLFRKTPNKYKK